MLTFLPSRGRHVTQAPSYGQMLDYCRSYCRDLRVIHATNVSAAFWTFGGKHNECEARGQGQEAREILMTEVYRRIRTAQGLGQAARERDADEAKIINARKNGNEPLAESLGRELAMRRHGRGPELVRRGPPADPNLPPREASARFEY